MSYGVRLWASLCECMRTCAEWVAHRGRLVGLGVAGPELFLDIP